MASAKRLGKRFIGYPEESIPVISTKDWLRGISRNPKQDVIDYLLSLFPIFSWITRYNLGWLSGDIIAGLTVGIVVVPQGMSYAQIATLPPEFGLYSSFVGVLIYCFFATSKDVSIGPVAVMSLTVSQIIKEVNNSHPDQWGGPQIATTLAFICGFIVLGIGLLRLGWIVEFIPSPAVSGFMTGSAISIVAGQVPGLMGITGFDTRAPAYRLIINTLKGLPRTKLDAAWGLTGLVCLYGIRMLCDFLSKKYPRRARWFFFISVLRNAFVILVLTIAAWLYTRHRRLPNGKYPIKILQDVPRGFKHIGQPVIDPELVSAMAGQLPVATIILLLEHIAISKSFGRLNGYKINPNQELIAIGVTNTIGSCFGAYPATGSFSRSALKSKSGVKTPAAGILTSVVVIVALYGLTPAFYWIPSAALSAVIIHAVADLVASPAQVFSFWRVSPLEFIIWAAAVLVTVFSTIENGIYVSICTSLALLLIRIAFPRGAFLGRVTVRGERDTQESRDIFVPLSQNKGILNEQIRVVPPAPGVLVYRIEESYLYPNSSRLNSTLVDYVKANMKRGRDMSTVKLGDRAWNDPGPSRSGLSEDEQDANEKLPVLHAIVLDFSAISHVDTTAVQSLIDTRNEIERWVDHPFHFATVLSPWIRRALVAAGFGGGVSSSKFGHEIAPVVPYRDGLVDDSVSSPYRQEYPIVDDDGERGDIKKGSSSSTTSEDQEFLPILPPNTPFFHIDLVDAVRAAESGLDRADSAFVAHHQVVERLALPGMQRSSRASYPTFLSLQDTVLLQLGWAFQGLLDAFRWDIVFTTVSSDPEIRANVFKSLLLNSLSLISIFVFDILISPLVQNQQRWLHRNVGWFYQALWLLPVVGVSFYLNSSWCSTIAKRTYMLNRGARAAVPQPMTYSGMLRSMATSAYRGVMVFTSVVVSLMLSYVPFIGPAAGFVFLCWVDSYYCFEFVWIASGYSLSRRIRYLEERWAYFFTFGLPSSAICMWGSSLANAALFALVFPSFIIMAMHARPVPLDPYSPIASTDVIRHPSPFVPIRIPIFAPVLWLNDWVVAILSVGGGRRPSGGRSRALSDSTETVEEGNAVELDTFRTKAAAAQRINIGRRKLD